MTSARAVVLAAGMGTRMKSAQPKVLHDICGRPMLWYALRALRDAGVTDIVTVTNARVDAEVAPLLASFGARSVVQEPQRGTGHAVQTALAALPPGEGSLIVAYGDMPLVSQALFQDALAAIQRGAALGLITARMPLPSNFGRVVRHGDTVARIVEARDCSAPELAIDEMNCGIYAFDEPALRGVIGRLSDDNAQQELYLTDTVALLVGDGKRVVPVKCGDYRLVLGVNDRVELAKARDFLNRTLCEAHMRAGVTIVDPATTYLEPDLQIETDTVIYPNTTIGGPSRIASGARIGPNSQLYGAVIGRSVTVNQSAIYNSEVGDHVRIGPFAHLRGNSVVGSDVHIGNYVELKNTVMRDGAKANHLAYVGDSEVGERANIGAGTITCNYDGVNKNRTEIGRDAFIGSNSSLVAPIRIGDGAATGAGSVVIRDVADGERVVGNPARVLPKKALSSER
ncbi:MAG: bifunctional UDP-N-acetylglucosamine diphosphorylase/glucosamine-1-phosphate N-acetyltransferase GlmU [Candidatus Velthaea sp.]